jgi:hypothetical protein
LKLANSGFKIAVFTLFMLALKLQVSSVMAQNKQIPQAA